MSEKNKTVFLITEAQSSELKKNKQNNECKIFKYNI